MFDFPNQNTTPDDDLLLKSDFFEDKDDTLKPKLAQGVHTFKVDKVSRFEGKDKGQGKGIPVMFNWEITALDGDGAGQSTTHRTMIGWKRGKSTIEDGRNTRQFLRVIGITPELEPQAYDENHNLRLTQELVVNRTFSAEVIWAEAVSQTGEKKYFVNLKGNGTPATPPGKRFEGTLSTNGLDNLSNPF